jgi:hypothetical protein
LGPLHKADENLIQADYKVSRDVDTLLISGSIISTPAAYATGITPPQECCMIIRNGHVRDVECSATLHLLTGF